MARWSAALALVVSIGLWSAFEGRADQHEKTIHDSAVEVGGEYYRQYCAVCHGTDGKGKGAAFRELLTVKPPDLTKIAARNGGTFPSLNIAMMIDGRTEVRAHGARSMPIWGNEFLAEPGGGGSQGEDVVVRGRVMLLVEYLKSIQEK